RADIQAVYPMMPSGSMNVELQPGQQVGGMNVDVRKLPPLIVVPPDSPKLREGASATINLGTFTESGSGAGPWSVRVRWGDGSPDTTFTTATPGALRADHAFADSGNYAVTVQVRDAFGTTGAATFTLPVRNLMPTLQPLAGPTLGVRGQPLTFAA